jgi:hypothetical protein
MIARWPEGRAGLGEVVGFPYVFTFLAREREAGIAGARQADDAIAGCTGRGRATPKIIAPFDCFSFVFLSCTSKSTHTLQWKKKNTLVKNEDFGVLFFLLKFETIILVVI